METAIDAVYNAAGELATLAQLAASAAGKGAEILNDAVYSDVPIERAQPLTADDANVLAGAQELISRVMQGTGSPELLGRLRAFVKASDADPEERIGIHPLRRLSRHSAQERGGGLPTMQYRKLLGAVERMKQRGATRREVARQLGAVLGATLDRDLPAPELTDLVLQKMPARAAEQARSSSAPDAAFVEHAEQTVNAAYRAFGVAGKVVHQLDAAGRQPQRGAKSRAR